MGAYFKRIYARLAEIMTGGVLMREQKLFLSTVSLFYIATAMSAVFVNTFIYSCAYASGEIESGLRAVAYYNLCMYASVAFFSVIIGIIGKNVRSRMLMLTGLVFYALLYILILILGSRSVGLIWLLGLLSGAGSVFFNLNYSSAATYATSAENRGQYLSLQGSINISAAAIAPLFAALLSKLAKGMGGYIIIFVVSLVILAASGVHCFGLSYNDGKNGNTQFGNVFVFSVKNKDMRSCVIADMISGLREGAVSFLIPVLLFTIDMSNISVAMYLLVCTVLQAFASNLAQRYVGEKSRNTAIFIAAVMFAISGFILLLGIDKSVIFSYGAINAFVQGVFISAVFTLFYEASYKIPHSNRKNLEIMSVREFYINIGRIVATFIIMLVLSETTYMIYTLVVFGILQIAVPVVLVFTKRENVEELQQ